jgi:hypothetical protein
MYHLKYASNVQCRVFTEKLTVTHLIRKLAAFIETELLSSPLQRSIILPKASSKTAKPVENKTAYYLKTHWNISSHLPLMFQVDFMRTACPLHLYPPYYAPVRRYKTCGYIFKLWAKLHPWSITRKATLDLNFKFQSYVRRTQGTLWWYRYNAGTKHASVALLSCSWQKPMKFPHCFCVPVNKD